jgi:hypothetical protein
MNVAGDRLSYSTNTKVIKKNVTRLFVMIFSGIHHTVFCVQVCSLYMYA